MNSLKVFAVIGGIFLIALLPQLSYSQNTAVNKARALIEVEKYPQALQILEEIIYEDAAETEAHYLAAICFMNLKNYRRAQQMLVQLSSHPEMIKDEGFKYHLAKSHLLNEDFGKAKQILAGANTTNLKALEAQVLSAEIAYEDPLGHYIENMGSKINTKSPEYSTLITEEGDMLYFTRRTYEYADGSFKEDDLLYDAPEQIFYTTLNTAAQWNKAEYLDKKSFGKKSNEATVQLINNEKMLIHHNSNLYAMEKKKGQWEKPTSLNNPFNSEFREVHGFLSSDGQKMFIVSNRLSNGANLDILMSKKDAAGNWTTPKAINLVNTPSDEEAPFFTEDGTLYFASKGHNSIGGYDIFKSQYDEASGRFSKVENLGYPINSTADDIYFTIHDGSGYFSSNRKGGYGQEDIYMAHFKEETILAGIITDKNTGKPQPNVTVVLTSANGEATTVRTDSKGNYQFKIIPQKEMGFKVLDAEGQLLFQTQLTLTAEQLSKEKIILDWAVENIWNETLVDGESDKNMAYSYIFGQVTNGRGLMLANTNVVLTDVEYGEVISRVTTDEDGFYKIKYYPTAGKAYIIEVEKKAHTKREYSYRYNGKTIRKDFELNASFASQPVPFKNVYYDYAEAYLSDRAYVVLDIVVKFMYENPSVNIMLEGHTDNIGSEAFNKRLSLNRSRSVANYLIEMGLSADRIDMKGYGESMPLASNDDEKEGRELNRRVHLRITNYAFTAHREN